MLRCDACGYACGYAWSIKIPHIYRACYAATLVIRSFGGLPNPKSKIKNRSRFAAAIVSYLAPGCQIENQKSITFRGSGRLLLRTRPPNPKSKIKNQKSFGTAF
jgi:hypothetical protein